MARTELGAEWQRFRLAGLSSGQPVRLTCRAIDKFLAIRRPGNVGDVALRRDQLPSPEPGNVEQNDQVIRPLALDLNNTRNRRFSWADRGTAETRKCALVAGFRVYSLGFDRVLVCVARAEFSDRIGSKRHGCRRLTRHGPQPQSS